MTVIVSNNALRVFRAIEANSGYYVGGWVPMGTIREVADIQAFGERSRNEEFCLALRELASNGAIDLIPEENQKTITSAMLTSGAFVGGRRNDYARISD